MIGLNHRFLRYQVEPFEFPELLNINYLEIRNERHFIEFFLRNQWVQRMVGVQCNESNGYFPDLKAHIYGDSTTKINVEMEYWAQNYKAHKHPYGGCDLIISFLRLQDTRFIAGVPVWSFYKGKRNGEIFEFCLFDDMNYDFGSHHLKDDYDI